MNIFKLMQAMRPYIQSGEMTYDLAIKYLKERGVQFDGLVKKALDNMFKKTKARDPVFDKSVTKMHFDEEGLPFDPKTLKTIEEKRKYVIHHPNEKIERAKKLGVENLFEERTLPFGKNKDLTKVNIAKEIKREKTLQSALDDVPWQETTAPFNPKAAAFYDDVVEESTALAKRTGKDVRSLIEERIGYKFKGNESMKEIIDIVEAKFFKADGGRIGFNQGGTGWEYEPMFTEKVEDFNVTEEVPSRIGQTFTDDTQQAFRVGNVASSTGITDPQTLLDLSKSNAQMRSLDFPGVWGREMTSNDVLNKYAKQGIPSDYRHALGTSAFKDSIIDYLGSNLGIDTQSGILDTIGSIGAKGATII